MTGTWSYSVGDYGDTVRVYERTPGGMLYLAIYDPTMNDGRGGYARQSLKTRDRKEAKKRARTAAHQLETGDATHHRPTLGYLVDLYLHHQVGRLKPKTQKWLRQFLRAWVTYLGKGCSVRELGPKEWEAWKTQRRTGAIDGNGRTVDGERRTVRPGTINLGLEALMMCLNWAVRWRVDGRALLERNPLWKLPFCDDVNVQRAVWTWDRFEAVVAAAEQLTMQVEWHGTRERIPCYLADVLVLAEATGRRIGAVRQLRYEDLQLDAGQHGKIRWPSETDKGRKLWTVPITLEVRKRLLKILRERPGLGAAPLFPAPRDRQAPVQEDALRVWLRKAEQRAGVPRLAHDSFHGLRRKWATERKHHPDVDVAAAGGWRSIATMKRSYQQADDAGVLEAVMAPRRLRERA